MKGYWIEIVWALFVLALACMWAGAFGVKTGRWDMQQQAVERGCGRYVVTAEREVKFEWVDCARKEQGK